MIKWLLLLKIFFRRKYYEEESSIIDACCSDGMLYGSMWIIQCRANNALKIAIVSSPSGVDDGSFNEDNYNGIQNFIKENPDSTVTPIQETTGDTDAAVQAVADIVADYDVIVCCPYRRRKRFPALHSTLHRYYLLQWYFRLHL